MLHFHPDNVCSEDGNKVSMKYNHCLLPLLCFYFIIILLSSASYSFSHFSPVCFMLSPDQPSPWFPVLLHLLCADGRQPKPKEAASFSAVHVGSKLCPSLYSFLSYSPLGAASKSQTTPPLHAREMPHTC